jgi:hypothetical protein
MEVIANYMDIELVYQNPEMPLEVWLAEMDFIMTGQPMGNA